MIIVKDDFFKADLCNLIAKGTETYQWRYDQKSYVRASNKFFVSHLWTHPSEDNLFHMVWKLIHNEVPSVRDCDCWRIIANGSLLAHPQTYFESGS